jgi:pimeloyl-ACP methyl ester carboxylesterase
VGQSAAAAPPDPATFTFDDDVADAVAWAAAYSADRRLSGLVLAGHSEGALWATLIAERLPTRGVISLEGAGRPIGQVLAEQLAKQLAGDSQLLTQANQILAALEAGMTVASVPSQLASVFDPSVQPYLISWMRYDPAAELAKLSGPVLIVQGTTDTQVDIMDANLLAAANPSADLVLVDGMCHVLKDAALDSASQTQAYTNPALPLDATMVSKLTAFVR